MQGHGYTLISRNSHASANPIGGPSRSSPTTDDASTFWAEDQERQLLEDGRVGRRELFAAQQDTGTARDMDGCPPLALR
jgi:hypothetical protein